MRFKIFGDADAPDWVLAEMFAVSRLSSVRVRALCTRLVDGACVVSDDASIENQSSNDVAPFALDPDRLRAFVDASNASSDVEASTAALAHVITEATRHDADERTVALELERLGLPREHAEAVARPYGKNRERLRASARRRVLRVDALMGEGVRWGVTFGSGSAEDAPSERLGVRLTLHTREEGVFDVDVSEEKFRVLLGELKAVKALMDADDRQ